MVFGVIQQQWCFVDIADCIVDVQGHFKTRFHGDEHFFYMRQIQRNCVLVGRNSIKSHLKNWNKTRSRHSRAGQTAQQSNKTAMSKPTAVSSVVILRSVVTVGLLAAGLTFGVVSFYILSSYEYSSATSSFNNLADHAFDSITQDMFEKDSTTLSMSKNMAYFNSNETEWPNVIAPGFYDMGYAQRDASSLGTVFFLPLVPPEKLASFESFMNEYYASEPETNNQAVRRVFASGPNGGPTYLETDGTALAYESPYAIIAPLAQVLFTEYIASNNLLYNMHSGVDYGPTMDTIVDCSKRHNYTAASQACSELTSFVAMPLGATGGNIKFIYSAFLEPIYLEQNTSKLVGFMGGGFDWAGLLTPVFRTSPSGIEIVVKSARQGDEVATFLSDSDGTVKLSWPRPYFWHTHVSIFPSATFVFLRPFGAILVRFSHL